MTQTRSVPKRAETSTEGLDRAIGPVALSASLVNMTVGSGILMLPAIVAREVGRAAPLAYLLAGGVMTLVALCFAEAGARTSRSGGPYMYARTAFGPFAGYMTGMLLYGSNVLAMSAVCAGLASWLGSVWPVLLQPFVRAVFLAVVYAALVGANLRGVRSGAFTSTLLSVVKVSLLLVAVVVGAAFVDPANVTFEAPASAGAFGRAAMLLVLAFSGLEMVLCASGEIRDPSRTVPIALATSLGFVVVLYMALQFVTQGVLGPALSASQAPLADALRPGGPTLHWLIVAGGTATLVGVLAADLLGTTRVIFALADAGFLPRPLRHVNPHTHVPARAIVAEALVCYLFALTGTFESLSIFAALATMILYAVVCAAAWKLGAGGETGTGFLPRLGRGWLLIPITAIAVLLAMFAQGSRTELLATGAAGLSAAIVYVFISRVQGRRTPSRLHAVAAVSVEREQT